MTYFSRFYFKKTDQLYSAMVVMNSSKYMKNVINNPIIFTHNQKYILFKYLSRINEGNDLMRGVSRGQL